MNSRNTIINHNFTNPRSKGRASTSQIYWVNSNTNKARLWWTPTRVNFHFKVKRTIPLLLTQWCRVSWRLWLPEKNKMAMLAEFCPELTRLWEGSKTVGFVLRKISVEVDLDWKWWIETVDGKIHLELFPMSLDDLSKPSPTRSRG